MGMNTDLAFKLYYFADIRNIDDLKNCNLTDVFEKICDCKKEAEKLAKSKYNNDINKAYEELCGYSEEKIKEFKEKAQKELSGEKVEAEIQGSRPESRDITEGNTEPGKTAVNNTEPKNAEENSTD